ncbi:MAG TPA: hypothetical protein VE861_04845, partial [Gemmatimonadaceae bacterium]|nr:hypothetical protein [Gemmatimonadaceae bacterium]
MATALAALATTVTLSAQSVARDSAGVRIVTSTRPAWSDREALRLDGTPRLIIGYTTDSAYRFSQVRGVMLLSDGRIAVADGASGQLRLFSADGRFLSAAAGKGTGPGQLQQMVSARRIRGDTIAIGSDYRTVMLYSGTAQYARTMSMPVQPGRGPAGRSFLIAVLDDGTRIGAPMPHQAPRHSGSRWTDSVELQLLATNDSVVHRLGAFPHVELMTIGSELTQPWLSPIAAFAGGA